MPEFRYQEIFEHGHDNTTYRKLTADYVSTTTFEGQEILKIAPEALTLLAREAMDDVAHLLRPGHLQQLAHILDDPEASDNDRFVALELLKNANIAAGRVLVARTLARRLCWVIRASTSSPLATMLRRSPMASIRPTGIVICAIRRWLSRHV